MTTDTSVSPPAAAACPRARLRVRFGVVEMLEFAPGDAPALFEVRNHPSVRGFMPDPGPLDYQAHLGWVERNLAPDSRLRLFIVRQDGTPIGFTIFRRLPPDAYEIGVLFMDANHHTVSVALTAAAMLWLACEHAGAARVITYVNVRHERALALNRGFGLLEANTSNKPNELCFVTPAQVILANERYRRIKARMRRGMQVDEPPWPQQAAASL